MARDYCIFLRNKKSPEMALTAQRLRAVIEFKSVCDTGKGISLLLLGRKNAELDFDNINKP